MAEQVLHDDLREFAEVLRVPYDGRPPHDFFQTLLSVLRADLLKKRGEIEYLDAALSEARSKVLRLEEEVRTCPSLHHDGGQSQRDA